MIRSIRQTQKFTTFLRLNNQDQQLISLFYKVVFRSDTLQRPIAPNRDMDLVITLLVYLLSLNLTQTNKNGTRIYIKNIPIIVLFMTKYFNIYRILKS